MRRLSLAIARTTFDIPYAQDRWQNAQTLLRQHDVDIVPDFICDESALTTILSDSRPAPEQLIVFQATFADSTMIARLADHWAGASLVIWAPLEPRTGGRLRLNAFCGLQ